MKKNLVKSGIWVTAGIFTRRIFALLSNMVLARLLTPEDFGVISIAYVFWSLLILFNQNSTGLFILYKGIDNKKYLNTTYSFSLIVGTLFGLLLAGISPLIAVFFNEPNLVGILRIYSFNLVLSSIFYVYEAIMFRQDQYRGVAILTFIASIARLAVTVTCALMGARYWSFAFGDAAFWLISLPMAIWLSRHLLLFRISRDTFSEVAKYCLGAVGTSFGAYMNNNLDNFVVSKVLGNISLGYYSLAYQLSTALTKVFNPVVFRIGTPKFAQLSGDEEQRQVLNTVMTQIAFLITPFYAGLLISIDKDLITFVFGEQWVPVLQIMPWLIWAAYCRSINVPLDSMLSAKGLTGINARVNLQIAPLAVLSFYIGAKQGGVTGVAIAVSLVLGVFWTVSWWWTACRALGWPVWSFIKPYLIPFFITAIAIAISLLLPIGLKQVIFSLIYLLGIKIMAPLQFNEYLKVLKITISKIKTRFL